MARRVVVIVSILILAAAGGYGAYLYFERAEEPVQIPTPVFQPTIDTLPATDDFSSLAQNDPVAMFEACLSRYAREVKGYRALMEKQERVEGKLNDREIVQVTGWGEVPDAGGKTHIKVRMIWEKGARKDFLGNVVAGTLYNEDEKSDQILTYRPRAFIKEYSVDLKGPNAREASRFCIKDSGLYRSMLRTYTAWKDHKERGELRIEYLGKQKIDKADGRECHVIKRICPRTEVDSFALDEKPPTDPKLIERDGFNEVTVMIDAERWLQVGTVIRDAKGELVGEYFFRNVETVAGEFPPDTFTAAGLKAANTR
jgi:hypothetical protein